MSSPARKKSRGVATSKNSSAIDLSAPPPVVTQIDRIVLEIRKFLMSGIFFNSKAADEIGLGLTDMQLLHMLQVYGPSTPSRLAEATGLSSGGITVALDRLESAGYIRREPNPDDRRSLLVRLIPTRLAKLANHYRGIEADTRRQLAKLSPRDLEVVIHFFESMAAIRSTSQS
jgi:DNA-binding MarR family transcriptional regulator